VSGVPSLLLERFARLPQPSTEVWQGGLLRMPAWIDGRGDAPPRRPWMGFWVSLRTGLAHAKVEEGRASVDWTLALAALLEFGLKHRLAGCRPARIEVTEAALAAELDRALLPAAVTVAVVPELPAVREALAAMAEHAAGGPPPPSALDAAGITVERMRAFAEAARRFYEAAPWRLLSDEDLVHVEAPAMGPGLGLVTILGAAGQAFGLGFFAREEDFAALHEDPGPENFLDGRDHWAVLYGPIQDLPFGDVDLWEAETLPVAGPEAYPLAARFAADGTITRPDARTLADLEGLLLALADTSEEELDRGRWSREVRTFAGERTVTLAIPDLLEPLDAPVRRRSTGLPDRRVMERVLVEVERFVVRSDIEDPAALDRAVRERFAGSLDALPSTAVTPLDRAQELVYRAAEARGRRRVQLARRALLISADCADAYVLLAEHAGDDERARELYAAGVAAGERALGPHAFEEDVGRFWGIVATRPYMRARFGLAQCLEDLGRRDEALEHYRELLRLNPDDNQGVRAVLLPALLSAGLDEEAGELLARYEQDPSALWRYGQALWTFRREGDSRPARERLREAVRANRHVPRYLAGRAEWPHAVPSAYAFGSEEEAVLCALQLGEAWRGTPGAARWLEAERRKPRKHRR
jgi:tetratricopeptide (TPR) repeat protein